jgi:pimeloyl-ACP methyl ester carboxylesterase
MAGGVRKISAASARSHTRRPKQSSSFNLTGGLFRKILALVSVGLLAWAYQVTKPPPPMTCGSPDGPPVTAPRFKLSDGRYLAYKEHGVPREKAKHKIVFIHGFDSCSHHAAIVYSLPPEMVEDLSVYVVSFDRPGYGESDPNPNRTLKSMALDVEELADHLGLGSKFYVVGFSMGGQYLWTCLKYIPHRLAGAALLAPVINYWWTSFPANLSKEAYYQQLPQDQWTLRVSHYVPWLTYWWNTQKWFPSSSVIAHSPLICSQQDLEIIKSMAATTIDYTAIVRQQGEYESLHRDFMVGFGTWEFDPMDLENPFANKEGSVHLWHGEDDVMVSILLQRYIVQRLPWIRYHEVKGSGHLFPLADGMSATILTALLTGEK